MVYFLKVPEAGIALRAEKGSHLPRFVIVVYGQSALPWRTLADVTNTILSAKHCVVFDNTNSVTASKGVVSPPGLVFFFMLMIAGKRTRICLLMVSLSIETTVLPILEPLGVGLFVFHPPILPHAVIFVV